MLLLSLIALTILALQTFLPLEPDAKKMFMIVDTTICAVFFSDFLYQLFTSRSRVKYLKWGWLDLVSSIPMLSMFRIARLARVARILRILRGAKASRNMLSAILLHRARNTFAAVVFASFVILLLSVIAIVNAEPDLMPEDAIWWCLFTLITGDNGSFYPITIEGRIITVLLMTAGVAIFGTFTASVASFFLEEDMSADEKQDSDLSDKIDTLQNEISALRRDLNNRNSSI